MKKILILGANSFIARNFLFYIKKNNFSLTYFLYDYQERHLDGDLNYKKFSPLDPKSFKLVDLNVDIIYFFVGKTGTEKGFSDYNDFININEKTLLNLLSACVEQNSKAKIVFPSSRLVYKGSEFPLVENSEKEARTIYAANKISCEQYLKMYHNVYNINYCNLRLCIPYGTLIPDISSYGTAEFLINKGAMHQNLTLYGDGSQKRTFTFIGDVCEVLYLAGVENACINDDYNIGGFSISLKDLADLVALKYDVKVISTEWPFLAKKIESGSTFFDSSKLDKILNKNKYISIVEWINSRR